jgi:hypothetical protein
MKISVLTPIQEVNTKYNKHFKSLANIYSLNLLNIKISQYIYQSGVSHIFLNFKILFLVLSC